MALKELFDRHGFQKNPFGTFLAEHEDELDEWFVAPPFLRILSGDDGTGGPIRPASNVVFGARGSGKTALRIKLEHELVRRARNALVLRYVAFTNPLASTDEPTVSDHVEELLRLGTIELLGLCEESRKRYSDLSRPQRAEFRGLVTRYYEDMPFEEQAVYTTELSPIASRLPSLKEGARAAVKAYNAIISMMKVERIDPITWSPESSDAPDRGKPHLRMRRFWSLARAMGLDSIWVLLDRVDETPQTQTPEGIFKCVSALLLDQQLMEFSQGRTQVMCFKIFLTMPDEVGELLNKAKFRRDRIKVKTIEWSRKDLNHALTRRLAHFSNRNIFNFDEICEEDRSGTHDRLLDECNLRPRTLFRMPYEILHAFEERDDPTAMKLDGGSIDKGIKAALSEVLE